MNVRRLILGAILVVLGALGLTSYTGGYAPFAAPSFQATVTVPSKAAPAPSPSQSTPVPVEKPCNGKLGPTKYYANDKSTAKHNFGPSLDPNIILFGSSPDLNLDAKQVVKEEKERLCRDSVQANATAAAAFPKWYGSSPATYTWSTQVDKLNEMKWDEAKLEYHAHTPTAWTMMMISGKSSNAPPKAYITRANRAGWYLHVPTGDGHTLFLRVECGGQPSLDLREGNDQAVLTEVFETR